MLWAPVESGRIGRFYAPGPGTHLGNYEILALIGKGGMGEVYRARDTRPNVAREVAIKVSASLNHRRTQHFARCTAWGRITW